PRNEDPPERRGRVRGGPPRPRGRSCRGRAGPAAERSPPRRHPRARETTFVGRAFTATLRLSLERTLQLLEMVRIMRDQTGSPVFKTETPPSRVDANAVPVGGRERSQEVGHGATPAHESRQGFVGVVAGILPVLGPAIGIEWMCGGVGDAPDGELLRG